MVTFEDETVLDDFVKLQRQSPQTQNIRPQDGHATFLSQGDFGPLRGTRILPRLADFNLCFPGLDGRAHISAIQSRRYRAPEVLLGCPWTYSVDIWNFGVFVSITTPRSLSACFASLLYSHHDRCGIF